jgi:hypothetical protein
MSHTFCTYFDVNYLPRALALYESLQAHAPECPLLAMCMDEEALDKLASMNLPGLVPLSLRDLESFDPELTACRKNRSKVEYYWTCGAAMVRWLIATRQELDLLWYLDADTFFYSHPAPMFQEMQGNSVGIVEHRFAPRHAARKKFGTYNVGVNAFRRNADGLKAAEWWRTRCIEWCYDKVEVSRYADQKYLDDWPQRFSAVRVLQHKGVNVAPWNLVNYRLSLRNEQIFVDEQPLIIFHFHGLRELRPWLFDPNMARSGARLSRIFRRGVCGPYIAALKRYGQEGKSTSSLRRHDSHARYLIAVLKQSLRLLLRFSPRSYLLVSRGKVV